MIRDRNIEWVRERLYIPARDFGMITEPIAVDAGAAVSSAHLLGATPHLVWFTHAVDDGTAISTVMGTHTATNIVATLADAGQSVLPHAILHPTEYSTFGFGGFHIQTAGDVYSTFLRVPNDVDPRYPMGFKINYVSGSSTAADIVDWIILADFKAENVALLAPTTVLDTVIDVAGTIGTATADLNNWSSRGVKDADFLTRDEIEAGAAMMFSVELDSTQTTLSSEELHMLGVEIDYVPQRTRGRGHEMDSRLTTDGPT